jgi:hypothetical protein
MSSRGILSSPYQRRVIVTFSLIAIAALLLSAILVNAFTPETRAWQLVSNILVALTSSAMFALLSAGLLQFFTDPSQVESSTLLLPGDIDRALNALAYAAADYMLYVRTGRHFRAKVLPVLVDEAKAGRRRIKIEVILLDFREVELCQRYAGYRNWSLEYVQTEIMSTILKLIEASRATSFVDIDLYLSKRLSTFRLDGTTDEIIITREDRGDYASRYRRSDPYFAAFDNEFGWVKADAYHVKKAPRTAELPPTLQDMFGDLPVIRCLLEAAIQAKSEPSPYVR